MGKNSEKRIVKIRVLRRHIDKGNSSGYSCPVALAVIEKRLGRKNRVHVNDNGTIMLNIHRSEHLAVPASVRDFVWRFDEGKSVKPFSFELNLGSR